MLILNLVKYIKVRFKNEVLYMHYYNILYVKIESTL